MKYLVKMEKTTGKSEEIRANDAMSARDSFNDAKENPFVLGCSIAALSDFNAPVTLERFQR